MKRGHYAWAVCFSCLLLFLCNMGLCSNILTVYLPFIEARGISDEVRACADMRVKLPMRGGAESLNAAVAAGIMIYEMAR